MTSQLPVGWTEDITRHYNSLSNKGLKLYMLTLMFGYIPGLKRGGVWKLELLENRVTVLWHSVLGRLYNNSRGTECYCTVFWDIGESSSGNKGLHAHLIVALNEEKFREKYRGSFLEFWSRESSRYVARGNMQGVRDPLIRSHLQRFDGYERGIIYCCKSLEGDSGLGIGDVLVLGDNRLSR